MQRKIQLTWLLAMVVMASSGTASAALIVGSAPLAPSDATTYPGGVNPINVTLTSPAFNFTAASSVPGSYSYNPDGTFTVNNVANANNIKHLTLVMEYTPGDVLPQNPGDVFNPALWPKITNPGAGVTVTGASAIASDANGDREIFETFTINPQPASETFNLSFNMSGGVPGHFDPGGIFMLQVTTICTPEPGSLLIGLSGAALLALGAGVRKARRRFCEKPRIDAAGV